MALNTSQCNHLMPLCFKGLIYKSGSSCTDSNYISMYRTLVNTLIHISSAACISYVASIYGLNLYEKCNKPLPNILRDINFTQMWISHGVTSSRKNWDR